MRVIKQESLYQLTIMPYIFPVNCYFIEEEDGLTLIDAGLSKNAAAIVAAAQELGKRIVRIVLTHAHGDHVGALDDLKEQFPELVVYISARDSRLLAGDHSLDLAEPQTPIRGGVPKNLKTRADILLREGDKIGSLIAVETPGHTPGSMSYIDVRTNAMIVGDSFHTRGGLTVSGVLNPWFPFPAWATWNKPTALESAVKIRNLKPSLLAAGHGDLLFSPEKAVEKAILNAKKNLTKGR